MSDAHEAKIEAERIFLLDLKEGDKLVSSYASMGIGEFKGWSPFAAHSDCMIIKNDAGVMHFTVKDVLSYYERHHG